MLNSTLLFLRSALFYLGYFLVTLLMSLGFIVFSPLLRDRGRYLFVTTWCAFILTWLRLCCGVRYKIRGLDNIPDEPVVILSNHQSTWETILIYKLVFPVSPILKRELMRIPIWGWALRLQNPIAIDRDKPREAVKSLLTQGVDRLRQGNSVIIFPEGTRSRSGTIKRFSRGGAKLAVAANVPIVPIAHNAGYFWPPRKFVKRPGIITVVIGKKLSPKNRSASQLTDEVENWIRQEMVVLS